MAEIKYPLTPEERHQKDLEALEKLRPLDDTFMRELFRNDLGQHRTKIVPQMRRQFFRQNVQNERS